MTSCSHSFSEQSLSQWVTSCHQHMAIITCPVCMAKINECTMPNWALCNAIEKYPPNPLVVMPDQCFTLHYQPAGHATHTFSVLLSALCSAVASAGQ